MTQMTPTLALQDASKRGFIHLDIGGEGHYPDAINVNPHGETSNTPSSPIPRWVEGCAESLPFPDQCADLITVESAPMWGEAASEILRVIKKGGEIHLLHPEEQQHLHDQLIALSSPSHSQSVLVFMDYEGFAIRFIRTIIQT